MPRKKRAKTLRFSKAERTIRLGGDQRLELADGAEGQRPKVSMVAYTGGAIRTYMFPHPVVVDLKGMRWTEKARPLLADHNPGRVVGHTTAIRVVNNQLIVDGVLSGANETTNEIIASARNGMPWQASIGAPVERYEVVQAGSQAKVNGRTFAGPVVIVRASRLTEVSVVALGADDDTTTTIAARRQEASMEFEKWLRAQGWDPATLSDKQRTTLELAFKAEQEPDAPGDVDPDEGHRMVGAIRAQAAEEAARIAKITELASDYPEIMAQGIKAGWTPTKVELEVTRAQYATVGGIARPGADSAQVLNQTVIEAATMASLGQSDANRLKWYGEKTVEAADKNFRGIGLRDLVSLSLKLDKLDPGYGFGDDVIKAAFSTMSLPGITENVLNKLALMSYQAADIPFLRIAKRTRTSDFKVASRVRMLGTGKFQRVSKAGELESGTVGEQKFNIQADTYGQVLFIDRKTVRNDDLQILNDAAMEMGNTGAEAINHEGFTALLGAASFFTAGNGNLLHGTANVLGATGLNALSTLFRKQKAGPNSKAENQRPINIPPRILLVPPELEVTAQILVGSADIRPGGNNAETLQGTFNPWRGRYEVVSAPHLSDTSYSGYSLTAYYLLADPNRLPALEAMFLDGVDYPRVERVAPPATQLGIGFRGYIDFGVAVQDPKGIAKATGVAAP